MKINFLKINKLQKVKYDINKIHDKAILNALSYDNNENLSNEKIINNKDNHNVLISVKNLCKDFRVNNKTFSAVKNVSFDIYENQHVALLGGNGAGKTTIVEILAGLNKATKGNINYLFSNTNLSNDYKRKIGIQFQDSSYPTGISVKKVIKFIFDIYKSELSKDELNALIYIFGIDEFYFKRASSLSGGQQQRLNCLLAILHKPKFIILDEISTGLDIIIRNKIKKFIKEYAKQNNITLMLISHDMDEVNYIAERIIILRKGEIFINMLKEDIINKYKSITHCIDQYI